jgi:hypothetical protein
MGLAAERAMSIIHSWTKIGRINMTGIIGDPGSRSGIIGAEKIHGFGGYDATQAISADAFTEFTGGTQAFSTHYNTATFTGGRFTANKEGYYQINASFECPGQDDGDTFQLDIRRNGSGAMSGYLARHVQYSPKSNAGLGNAISTIIPLDGDDDYVSCWCYIEDAATVACYQFNALYIGN